jgi:hypothetical protein
MHAGILPAASRQLTIFMESVMGNLAIVNEARTVASGIFTGIGVKIRWPLDRESEERIEEASRTESDENAASKAEGLQ